MQVLSFVRQHLLLCPLIRRPADIWRKLLLVKKCVFLYNRKGKGAVL